MEFIYYPKCSTCQKAKKWLDEHNLSYEERDIKTENPTAKEIEEWCKESGVPLKKFFNTSGMIYKELNLKEKLPIMTDQEQYDLLATNGMLVKRPILKKGNTILLGFKPEIWQKELILDE